MTADSSCRGLLQRAARRRLVQLDVPPPVALQPDEAMFTFNEMVLVQLMPWDDNSLFAALSLLVQGPSPGSSAHQHFTTSMRHQTAFYMRRNWELFFKPLLRALCVLGDRHSGSDVERVRAYINDLASPGFPAGPEVVPAVAYVYDVDVMMYPEGGASYLVSTAPHPRLQVGIAHRLVWEGERRLKDYFDVVVSVHPKTSPVPPGLRVSP